MGHKRTFKNAKKHAKRENVSSASMTFSESDNEYDDIPSSGNMCTETEGSSKGKSTKLKESKQSDTDAVSVLNDLFQNTILINKYKQKNLKLRKKVALLAKQVRVRKEENLLASSQWLEELLENHKNLLLRYMKLEEKYKAVHRQKATEKLKTEAPLENNTQNAEKSGGNSGYQRHFVPVSLQQPNQAPTTSNVYEKHRKPLTVKSVGSQCNLIQDCIQDQLQHLQRSYRTLCEDNLKTIHEEYQTVMQNYKRDNMELMNRMVELQDEVKSREKQVELLKETIRLINLPSSDPQNPSRLNTNKTLNDDQTETPLTVEYLQKILQQLITEENVVTDSESDNQSKVRSGLKYVRKMIEACLEKFQQQQLALHTEKEAAARAEVVHYRSRCERMAEENALLVSRLEMYCKNEEEQMLKNQKLNGRITEVENICIQLRAKQTESDEQLREHRISANRTEGELQRLVSSLKEELLAAKAECEGASEERLKLENQSQGLSGSIMELKKQLEQKVLENNGLHAELERRVSEQGRLRSELETLHRSNDDCLIDCKRRVTSLQSELQKMSTNYCEKESEHLKKIRMLTLELDQMRIRSDTFQRQLASLTSTYNQMFGTTDTSDE